LVHEDGLVVGAHFVLRESHRVERAVGADLARQLRVAHQDALLLLVNRGSTGSRWKSWLAVEFIL